MLLTLCVLGEDQDRNRNHTFDSSDSNVLPANTWRRFENRRCGNIHFGIHSDEDCKEQAAMLGGYGEVRKYQSK